jgi:hypothetical protein
LGARPPANRRTGPDNQLDRDLDEVLERLPPDRVEPERDPLARERDELELEDARLRDEDDPERDADALLRDEDDPERDADALLRAELDRDDAEARERDEDDPLRDPLRELERRRDDPPFRSAAGISSRATAFASCSICFARNFAIRSSSRRMERASFAVTLSPTVSASDSMPE